MKRDNISNETLADEILSAPKIDDAANLQETATTKQLAAPVQTAAPEDIKPIAPDNDKVTSLPLSALEAFRSHPFKVRDNEDFNKLVDSVKENGVLIPAIARPKGDSYELIAGHRRKAACEKFGIETMPVIVRKMTDEQSVIFMVDSNVQRENILPSEKAFAFKMKMDALKRQGQRTDLTSSPVAWKSKGKETAEIIGEATGDSKDQVRRYIRLTELTPQLLKMVDEGRIAFRPAVELSHISIPHQKYLLSVMDAEQSTPSLSQAQKMKRYSVDGFLDETKISALMQEQKPNQKECIHIPLEKVAPYISKDMTPNSIVDYLVKLASEQHQRQLQKQRSQDAR
jgi:ParB family chromosome partitioning protein